VSESELDAWFIREVLPLEAALMRFLRRNWREESELSDLRQDVYVRVYDAARNGLPRQAKPFVFSTARNLLIDRVRRSRIISIETVADLDVSIVSEGEASPERQAIARDELRQLRAALEQLPLRCREVVVMRKIDGMPQREVAARLGITEDTVEKQVAKGVRMLANILNGGDAESGQSRVLGHTKKADDR
jgi:RNA polymerase sigma factor (sigma-70 family)